VNGHLLVQKREICVVPIDVRQCLHFVSKATSQTMFILLSLDFDDLMGLMHCQDVLRFSVVGS
jgi:hypothetical protein